MSKTTKEENMFCRLEDIGNESSVEQFFVSRLLTTMGFKDGQIKSKESLDKLVINLGRRKIKFRPDYAIKVNKKIRWVLDAKNIEENLDDWVGQCAGYCLSLNRGYTTEDPVKHFVLTNGKTLRVYKWNLEECVLELDFNDFQDGNLKFKNLLDLLGKNALSARVKSKIEQIDTPTHTLKKVSIDEVNVAFAWCYQHIHKKDNISQSVAFMEFIKVIFLKLLSDREIRRKYPDLINQSEITVPADEIQFSMLWIKEREKDHPNPLTIKFDLLKQSLEDEIQKGNKKRIFDQDEKINLTPETIKGVIERLEGIDLFSIDADLNGRLFETFLSATMRGKDLGQYFTPRSIVKLMVALAQPKAGREHIDSIFDPCCGTGGFLIDSLSNMTDTIDNNSSLTDYEKEKLKDDVAKKKLFGVDLGKEPPIARIARINMYLHGDGGSRIYQVDSLDKKGRINQIDTSELKKEQSEFFELSNSNGFCDIILTNPPFAKEYSRRHEPQKKILNDYVLAFDTKGGKKKPFQSLTSKVMFLERYYDFLNENGRVLAIVDDSILGSTSHERVRKHIREKYIVCAVISLPGDAFQRSKARVKTSILYLRKKINPNEKQPPVFMYYCTAVGLDDSARTRTLPVDKINRKKAIEEISIVAKAFHDFLDGKPSSKKWTVSPKTIADRLDVKHCLPKPGRQVKLWKKMGLDVVKLEELVNIMNEKNLPKEDIIQTKDSDEIIKYIKVTYEGFVEWGEEQEASQTKYSHLYRVHTNDIVISNLGSVYGAIAVVPKEFDGGVVTKEYIIYRVKQNVNPHIVQLLLRSPETRSDNLLISSGMGRHRIKWNEAKKLQLPISPNDIADNVVDKIKKVEELEKEMKTLREEAKNELYSCLKLETEEANKILQAFKPPK